MLICGICASSISVMLEGGDSGKYWADERVWKAGMAVVSTFWETCATGSPAVRAAASAESSPSLRRKREIREEVMLDAVSESERLRSARVGQSTRTTGRRDGRSLSRRRDLRPEGLR